jgi:hypothetical protein
VLIGGAEDEASLFEELLIITVEPVTAKVALGRKACPHGSRRVRARRYEHGAFFAEQGAIQGDYQQPRSPRVGFGVSCVGHPADAASKLEDKVLEPPTGPKERNQVCPGSFYGGKDAVGAAVRAPWHHPDAVEAGHVVRLVHHRAVQPIDLDGVTSGGIDRVDCGWDAGVSLDISRAVTDEGDPRWSGD